MNQPPQQPVVVYVQNQPTSGCGCLAATMWWIWCAVAAVILVVFVWNYFH